MFISRMGSFKQRILLGSPNNIFHFFFFNGSGYKTIEFVIDNRGSVITTGKKGTLVIDFDCEVVEWAIIATGASGAIVVDVNRSTFAGFPTNSGLTFSATRAAFPDVHAHRYATPNDAKS